MEIFQGLVRGDNAPKPPPIGKRQSDSAFAGRVVVDLTRAAVVQEKPLTTIGEIAGAAIGDWSTMIRAITDDIFMQVHPVHALMGLTTAMNAIWGALGAKNAWNKIDAAQKIGDRYGEKLARVELGGRVAQTIGGTAFLGYRGLSLAALLTHTSVGLEASTLLGRATAWAVVTGFGFFSLLYGVFGVISAINLGRSAHFIQKMEKEGTLNPDAMSLFSETIRDLKHYSEHMNKNDDYEKLLTERLQSSSDELKIPLAARIRFLRDKITATEEILNEKLKDVSEEELIEEGQKFYEEHKTLIDEKIIEAGGTTDMLEDPLFLKGIGARLRLLDLDQKKVVKASRVIDRKLIDWMKKYDQDVEGGLEGLAEKIEKGETESIELGVELIEQVENSLDESIRTHAWLVLMSVLGAVSLALLIFASGGTLPVIAGVMFFLATAIGFKIGLPDLEKAFANYTENGKYDKALVYFGLGVLVLAASGSITATLIFGFPLWVLLFVGLGVGVPWYIVQYAVLKKVQEAEEKKIEVLKPDEYSEQLREMLRERLHPPKEINVSA